jgi:hypothetical protein
LEGRRDEFFVEDFGKGSPSSEMEANPNGWEEMGSNFGERLLFPGIFFEGIGIMGNWQKIFPLKVQNTSCMKYSLKKYCSFLSLLFLSW